MTTRAEANMVEDVLRRTAPLRADIARFHASWPTAPATEADFPAVSWEQILRQVADLAATPQSAEIAREALGGLRKLSPWMPPEMVLRKALVIAWAAMDEQLMDAPEPSEAG